MIRTFEEVCWNADGRPRYRIDDQGSDSRRGGDDTGSGRRWQPLCGDRDLGILSRQVPCAAAPDRLPVAEGPDGRRASRAGAANRRTGELTPKRGAEAMAADNPRGAMFRVLMPDRQARVTNAELFFDLVFVFA